MATAAAFDVIIIGAGAAGLMCALTAGQRGRSVLLLDHADHLVRVGGFRDPRRRQGSARRTHSTLPVVDLDSESDGVSGQRRQ